MSKTLFTASPLFILICFFCCKSFSQTGCTPEAVRAYNRVNSLVQKAKDYSKEGDYNSEKKYAQEAVSLSKRIQDKYNCFSNVAFLEMATACTNLGDYAEALKFASNAEQFCETFKLTGCKCKYESAVSIGSIHLAMGNDSLALSAFKKAFLICEKDGQAINQAILKQNEAEIHFKTNDLILALKDVDKAEDFLNSIYEQSEFSQLILGRCYTTKAKIMLQTGDCESALAKFLASVQLAEAVSDRKTLATDYFNIARIYDLKARYSDALKNYESAVTIANQMSFTTVAIDSYFYMSNIYESQSDHLNSLKYGQEALDNSKKIEYKKGIVDASNVLGYIKEHLNEDEELLSYAKSALSIAKDINYSVGIADAYNNIETYYEKNKHYQLARDYANLAFNAADSIGYDLVKSDALNDLGDIILKLDSKKDSALTYHQMALKTAEQGNYKSCGKYIEGMVDAYNKIGNIYKLKRNQDKAFEAFYHAIELAKEISYTNGICVAENGIKAVKYEAVVDCQLRK